MRNAPPPNKKRKIKTVTEEKIDFDPAAREEYLTGFHKRKVARRKHAEEENAKKEKEEKLRFRKELRQQRKTDLEKHVEETNRLMRQANGDITEAEDSSSSDGEDGDGDGDDSVFKGFDDPINQQDEYIDEDKYTTVTVETVNINRVGFSRPGEEEAEIRKEREEREAKELEEKKKRVWTKERPRSDRPKKKKVKFRYETKVERKMERMKQGAKKRKAAEKRKPKE